MNILFVINALEIGGAETFLMRLMKELSKVHKVFLFTLKPKLNNSDFGKFFINESNAVVIKDFSLSKSNEYILYKINAVFCKFGYKKFFKRVVEKRRMRYFKKQILYKNKIEIINSHLFESDKFAISFLKPVTELPVVITLQGCYDTLLNLDNNEYVAAGITNILNCDAMTYVAEKNLDFLNATKTILPSIHKKINNGLERPQKEISVDKISLGINQDDFVIGQISRSIETKGMQITIRATISLVEDKGYGKLKTIIIGPENEYYQTLQERFKDKEYILFPGGTYNPYEWINIFDVGMLPTYFPGESCPSSLIEYLSCGKPVISTTIGEIPFIISSGDKSAGILIKEKDEHGIPKTSLVAEAIEKYYLDKELLYEHGKVANSAFEKFNIIQIAQEYLEIYNKVLTH